MKRVLLLALLLISSKSYSANVYIMDAGFSTQFYSRIQPRIIQESCHSFFGGDDRVSKDDASGGGRFYEYRRASLCRNKNGLMVGSGASLVRTDDLPGHRGGQEGDVDVDPLRDGNRRYHQYLVGNIVMQNTSPSVLQWHAHPRRLLGRDNGQTLTDYRFVNTGLGIDQVINGLDYLATNVLLGKRGVEVVNLSLGTGNLTFPTPCDFHPDVVSELQLVKWRNVIANLRSQGLVVVTGSGNSGDTLNMSFPACLSTTIAVAGINQNGRAYGDVSPHTDFIDNATVPHPVFNRLETGTSYSSPRVAAQVAELRTLNPLRSLNQVLNTTRSTSDLFCDSRIEGNKTHNFCIAKPNFQRAYASTVDSFWSDYVNLSEGVTVNTSLGWNYGTSRHKNGMLSYFKSTALKQKTQSLVVSSTTGGNVSAKAGDPALRYSFRPYDIDTTDELEILVNDKSYGFVETTGSNRLGPIQTVCITPKDLKKDGTNNEVKLKLKNSRETWGVTKIKVEEGVVDSSCIAVTNDPASEEKVTLTLGVTDSQEYGRNYGRDGNTNLLDVSFTPTTGRDHELSWRVYDIERDEMEVFLNDTKIRLVPKTFANKLGPLQKIIIPFGNLETGENILSFRVDGGNRTWGVTSLQALALAAVVDGEASTSTLLDEPDASGSAFGGNVSTDFTFEFAPRGTYYGETVKISFDSYVKSGGLNGFEVLLNGSRIKRISPYRGKATYINQSVTLDKSAVLTGSNTLTIQATTPNGGHFSDAGFEKVRVQTSSVPLLDVATRNIRVADDLKANKPFEATVVVNNIGAKASTANTLSFFVSDRANKSNSIEVANTTVAALSPGASRTVTVGIESSGVKNDRYFWACIGRVAEDILAANDCSAAIQLDVQGNAITPIIMMLLED